MRTFSKLYSVMFYFSAKMAKSTLTDLGDTHASVSLWDAVLSSLRLSPSVPPLFHDTLLPLVSLSVPRPALHLLVNSLA